MTTVDPNIVNLLTHGKIVNLLGLVLLISIAEFQPSIKNASAAAARSAFFSNSVRSKRSEQGKRLNLSGSVLLINIIAKFQPLIGKASPEIIALLNNGDEGIQKAGTDTLSTLPGEKQFIEFISFAHWYYS
jgi:hypothetical protein